MLHCAAAEDTIHCIFKKTNINHRRNQLQSERGILGKRKYFLKGQKIMEW